MMNTLRLVDGQIVEVQAISIHATSAENSQLPQNEEFVEMTDATHEIYFAVSYIFFFK